MPNLDATGNQWVGVLASCNFSLHNQNGGIEWGCPCPKLGACTNSGTGSRSSTLTARRSQNRHTLEVQSVPAPDGGRVGEIGGGA